MITTTSSSNKRCLIKFQVDTIKTDISYLHTKKHKYYEPRENKKIHRETAPRLPQQLPLYKTASFNALQETINYHKKN